jgi:hypothetical protein
MSQAAIVHVAAQPQGVLSTVDGAVFTECTRLLSENAALYRENHSLQQQIAELTQSRADVAATNRELADVRLRLETATATIQRLENEKAGLTRELEGLRAEHAKWFRPLVASIRKPITTGSPSAADFRHCVSGWNRVIALTGKGWFYSDAIPLKCTDEWELRGWFRFTGRPDMVHYLALDCYTDMECLSDNQITARSVTRVSGTEAVLAEDCKSGDRVLKLKGESVASWPSQVTMDIISGRNYQCIAFGPDNLPNFNLSSDISQCRMNGNILEVELYAALEQAWMAGTAVRMHKSTASFVYGHLDVIGSTWQEIVMNHSSHPLRPGTNSVKILILCCHTLNSNRGYDPPPHSLKGNSLSIRNLRWEKHP